MKYRVEESTGRKWMVLRDGVPMAETDSAATAADIVKALDLAEPLCGYDLGGEYEGVRRVCRMGKNHHGPCAWNPDLGKQPSQKISDLFPKE